MQHGTETDAQRETAALVARCLQADEAAWPELVGRYERLVYAVLRRFTLPESDASDVFADVFSDLWRNLDQLENPGNVGGWLARVTYRRCLEHVREQRRREPLAADEATALADGCDHESELLQLERQQQVREALEALPSRCRQLFTWLFYTEPAPSYAEVARRLGLAANSVGFVRGRCLRRLRRELEQRGSAP